MKIILTALLLSAALPAFSASVYECTDGNGKRTYTQNPRSNCTQTDLGRPNTYTSAPAPAYSTTSYSSYSSDNVPVESVQNQETRQRLEQAQRNLEEGKQVRYGNERNYQRYQERISGLEQAVTDAQNSLK